MEGDLSRITLKACNSCENCQTILKEKMNHLNNDTQRKLKAAYWRVQTNRRDIVEIIEID